MNRGREMIRECVECNNRQIGYSNQDGDACEWCGGYTDPKGWVHVGVDLAKGKDITVLGEGHHTSIIDEMHEYYTKEDALKALIIMDNQVINSVLNEKSKCQSINQQS